MFSLKGFKLDLHEAFNFKKYFNVDFFLITATTISANWVGILLIGFFLNKEDVALYNSAVKISFSMNLILQTINQITASRFALYHKNNQKSKIKKLAKRASLLCTALVVPTGIVLILFSSEILGFFDESFKSGNLVLLILLGAQFINAITGSVGTILQMTNEESYWRRKSIESFVLNILLSLILLYLTGINGAAVGQILAISYLMLSSVYYLKKNHGISSVFFIK
ncbi:lipopolysaccharide biosynthesis protein [Neotamlana laminarinivorans]|uniref:lipopolysaccharide biosynthesis protein n=1 Tax=Neotamlana laminarinivorans TaxID=2883124 RepID=UPI001CF99388|nr:polysaccharide biosynthesis C-terminal domain-containing protein [Tamlana laminarinivorans]